MHTRTTPPAQRKFFPRSVKAWCVAFNGAINTNYSLPPEHSHAGPLADTRQGMENRPKIIAKCI